MQKQIIALLEVIKQVAQTSMADFCAVDRDTPTQLANLLQAEQTSLNWLTEQVILAKRLVIVPDIRTLPQVDKFLGQENSSQLGGLLHFYAGFPVHSRQQIVGVVSVLARHPHELSPDQQSAIATLADQIGYLLHTNPDGSEFGSSRMSHIDNTLESTLLTSSLDCLERSRATMLKLSMALQQCLSLEGLNNQLIAVLPHELPIAAFELLLAQGSHAPQRVCLWPADTQISTENSQIICHNGVDLRTCLLTKQGRGDVKRFPAADISLKNVGKYRSGDQPVCHCYPLTIKQRTMGALKLYFRPSSIDWPISEQACFASIAEQISITVNRLQLFQKLQSESLQDPLTKLFNRRYMMSMLTKLLQRVSYGHYQVGFIMMDIDHFKRLNDTFGHDAGDQVLRVIGLFLKGHARPNDAICRYGGEEFALILSDLNWEVLERRANQLCRGIRYLSVNVDQEALHITLSAGFAIAPLHGTTPATLIKAADQALYEAKRAGRDRAVGAPFPETVLEQQLRAAQSQSPLDHPPFNE